MMTQRIAAGATPKASAIAGSAMLIAESSETISAPRAARSTGIRQVYVAPPRDGGDAARPLTCQNNRGRRDSTMIQVDKAVRGKETSRAENQKGEKVVTGRATVTLPSRG